MMAFEVMIFWKVTGKVLTNSSPVPSAFNKARGISKTKIPPMKVEVSIVVARKTSKFAITNDTIKVSRTGKAKKNAVEGFLEEIFRSLKIYPNKGVFVLMKKSFVFCLDILIPFPIEIWLTVFKIHFAAKQAKIM